ncbi:MULTISPECIES: hypothetical protein [Mycobacterium ulcerans group]|uniref:hypothetical protein n=1 Tax=Mycobacterium ulcerans group TaxID=2993898 RepID=UPI0015E8424B|nr:hypothetical protein [Mycobacterium marinum]
MGTSAQGSAVIRASILAHPIITGNFGVTPSGQHPSNHHWKILSPDAKRRAVDMLKEVLGMSERLACKAVGRAHSTYRRTPLAATLADPDALLRQWLRT